MLGMFNRPWAFRLLLVVLNVSGLVWIRHDLTATRRPRLRVLAALPTQDIDRTDRFSLIFDEPLPMAGTVGAALVDSPFVIEPAVDGAWIWSAPERLEYKLDRPLPAGRQFKLRPSASMERLTGRTLVGQSEFLFKTRPLKWVSSRVLTVDPSDVQIELRFNQPVNPADLRRHIRLTQQGREDAGPLNVQVLTPEPAEILVIRARRPDLDQVNIHINAGLTGNGGDLSLGEDASAELAVSPKFALRGATVETVRFQKNISVSLEFSRRLKRDQPVPRVSVEPSVAGLQVRFDRHGIRLEGPFQCGATYAATVRGGLLSNDEEPLDGDQTTVFEVPRRQPSVSFPIQTGVLSPNGNLLLDLRVVNVGGLNLKVSRLHANNLAAHLRGEEKERTSRQMPARTIRFEKRESEVETVAVDLKALIGEPLGIYRIDAEATDHAWTNDSTVVAVTDLALTCKQERDGLLAWITSLSGGKPVARAQVHALSVNNQVLASGTTDADGVVRLTVNPNHPDGKLWLVTARLGEDLCFLLPEQQPWVLDEVDSSGREHSTTYDVMLYPERGVYRPGETIHLTGIVRDGQGQVPPPLPLSLTVKRPDGREAARIPIKPEPGRQGMFHTEFAASADARTGPYRFTVGLPGSDSVLGRCQALIEEFVPVRMEVQIVPAQSRFAHGQPPVLDVQARYLFGQPAADLPLSVTGFYQRESFRSKRFPDYAFDDPAQGRNLPISFDELTLDEAGRATVRPNPPGGDSPGHWRAGVSATVTEPGGRSVSDDASFYVDGAERYIGLRMAAGRMVQVGTPASVAFVQVTGADEPAEAAPMSYTLLRVEQDMTLEEVNGRLIWKSTEHVETISGGEIGSDHNPINQGEFAVTCPGSGHYRLRVQDCFTGVLTQIEFHATDASESPGTLTSGKPERVEIVLDKEKYAPGSTARLLIKSPFAGLMLLAVETDRIVDHKIIPLDATSLQFDLPVDEKLRGGAFVTATVVRSVNPAETNWLPHRAMGMARLMTDHTAHALPITLSTTPQAEPGQKLRIRVATASPSNPQVPPIIHLWAVDEGILLTSAFRTPSPFEHFLAPRRLGVSSADVFGDLLPDHRRPAGMTRIGGDGGDEDESAYVHSPVAARKRAPAVIWRDSVLAGADGSAEVELVLPDMTGEMRLMAVAVEQDRYGSAEYPVTVTQPLLVESSWPRFAAPNDQFEVPVKLFNSTGRPLDVQVETQVDGPLRIDAGVAGPSLQVQPNQPATFWLHVTATDLGPASVRVRAIGKSASGESWTGESRAELPIRPAGSLHAESKLLRLSAGTPATLEPPAGFLTSTTRMTLTLSPQPSVQLRPVIEQLLEYPYGCVEQTTSRLYVLLHAPELLATESVGQGRVELVKEMLSAGIARLASMQTRSGGLSYWPGSSSANLWGTTYAAEFLVQAERAGHPVDSRFMTELAGYLELQIDRFGSDEEDLSPDENMRADICRVLSAMKRPPLGWMTRLSEHPEQLDMAGKARLAAAWLDAGRKDRAVQLLSSDAIEDNIATTTGGRLTSQVRQEAVLLGVLLDLDKDHPWIAALVQRLEQSRRNGAWGSTLENASAVSALARYQSLNLQPGEFQGTVRVGSGPPMPFSSGEPATFKLSRVDAPIVIESAGRGDIHVSMTTRGLLHSQEVKEQDRQLVVSRKWTDRDGKPVDPRKLKVGDLVLVETSLAAPTIESGTIVENVAVVDALPGGLEVENPRLASSDRQAGHESSLPDHVEFRDDRVVLFSSADREPKLFRYAVRVVTAGTFAWPPIEATCMYDTAFLSVRGGGKVEVGR